MLPLDAAGAATFFELFGTDNGNANGILLARGAMFPKVIYVELDLLLRGRP